MLLHFHLWGSRKRDVNFALKQWNLVKPKNQSILRNHYVSFAVNALARNILFIFAIIVRRQDFESWNDFFSSSFYVVFYFATLQTSVSNFPLFFRHFVDIQAENLLAPKDNFSLLNDMFSDWRCFCCCYVRKVVYAFVMVDCNSDHLSCHSPKKVSLGR